MKASNMLFKSMREIIKRVGACIKRALQKYEMNYQGVNIKDAHDGFEWCKTHFSPNEMGA
jgi:hypothetical protein